MIISNSDLRWLDYLIIHAPRLKSLKKLIMSYPEYFTIITYEGKLLICVDSIIADVVKVKHTPIGLWHRTFDKAIYTVYHGNSIDTKIVYKIINWFTNLEINIQICELGRSISDLTI